MDDDQALETAVRDLADAVEDLRAELQEPRRGPLGRFRPPSPRELLRFTEQHTIPALVAILETNVRMLELLAAAIRVADGRPLDAVDRGDDGLETGRRALVTGADGLAAASRATLERLDAALAELQEAADGGAPDDPEVQWLQSEARALRAKIDEGLEDATDRTSASGTDPGVMGDDAESRRVEEGGPGGPVEVDVEEELETLRREADREDDSGDGGGNADDDTAGS
ncbi:hypothetical protein BRC85_10840 [Halobacteriales archaeon QS_1_69_70]|nr:MAG: hypothetical protein BRC85_10840 [Halobacteriales archaeon QS_1_69_70]